jgi:hypothetical protein
MEIPTKIVEIDADKHRDDGDSDTYRDGGEIGIEIIDDRDSDMLYSQSEL